jgi:hypothetical protein
LAGGLAGSLLEKLGRRFYHPNLLGDRCRDPLVQRHAIFFRQPLGSLLEECGSFNGYVALLMVSLSLAVPPGAAQKF